MIDFIVGEKVLYIGLSSMYQLTYFANYSDPRLFFNVGDILEIAKIEEHTWHTNIWIKGVNGVFNSLWFTKVDQTVSQNNDNKDDDYFPQFGC